MREGGGVQDGVECRGGNGTTVIAKSINILKKRNHVQAREKENNKASLWKEAVEYSRHVETHKR